MNKEIIERCIGSTNFCTITEAFNYVRRYDENRWLPKIFKRKDLTLETAFNWCNIIDNEAIWSLYIGREDLEIEIAMGLLRDLKMKALYKPFCERPDVFRMILDMPKRKAISYAKRVKAYDVWNLVITYKATDAKVAIGLAEIADDIRIWVNVVSRTSTPRKLALECVNKLRDDKITLAYLLRSDVYAEDSGPLLNPPGDGQLFIDYIDGKVTLIPTEILELAIKSKSARVWKHIVRLPKISTYISHLKYKDLKNYLVYHELANCPGIEKAIRNMDPEDAISAAMVNRGLWKYTKHDYGFEGYLKGLTCDEAIALAKKTESTEVAEVVFNRPDVIEYLKN